MGCISSHEDRPQCVLCGCEPLGSSRYCATCHVNVYLSSNRQRQPTRTAASPKVVRVRPTAVRQTETKGPNLKANFGEYSCICGRRWNSRLSWAERYQVCKRCKRNVFPHSQREVRPSDLSQSTENRAEHPKELCQMCQQLGRYCGKARL